MKEEGKEFAGKQIQQALNKGPNQEKLEKTINKIKPYFEIFKITRKHI